MTPWNRLLILIALITLTLPAHATLLDELKEFRTASGMRVILAESHALPMLEVRLLVAGGGSRDPEGKSGTASLTARMLTEGAGELDAETLGERLAFHGIRLSASTQQDMMEIQLTTLTENREEAWTRLADVVLRPRFDEKAFQRVKEQRLAQLLRNREDPDIQASLAFHRLAYGNHPYARPVQGSEESLATITPADLRAFHQRWFHGPEMVLVAAGDIDEEGLRELLERHFPTLDPSPVAVTPMTKAARDLPGQSFHQTMDLTQTTLWLGLVGLDRDDPDYYPFYLLNHILGGAGDSSRLHEEIREKRGLSYAVFSHFSRWVGRGPFLISLDTKTSSASQALILAREQVALIHQQGVRAEELERAKSFLVGSFPLRLDGLSELTSNLAVVSFFDLGLDYLERWPQRIQAVTLEEVNQAARKYLVPERLHVVSVGQPLEAKPTH